MQLRKPAQRAFSGLVGRPPDLPEESAPTPKPVSKTNAQRQREFRKRQREKKAKEKADQAMQRAVAGVMKEHPDDRGRRMTGAPHRKGGAGVISSVPDVVANANAQERNERTLGPADSRDPSFCDFVGGRRRVQPEGVAETPDVVLGNGGTFFERPTKRFKVKLDAHEFDLLLSQLAKEIFEDLGPTFRCRRCQAEIGWLRDCKRHVAEVHGALVRVRAEESARKERELVKKAKKSAALEKERREIEQRQQSRREGWSKPVTAGAVHK